MTDPFAANPTGSPSLPQSNFIEPTPTGTPTGEGQETPKSTVTSAVRDVTGTPDADAEYAEGNPNYAEAAPVVVKGE